MGAFLFYRFRYLKYLAKNQLSIPIFIISQLKKFSLY